MSYRFRYRYVGFGTRFVQKEGFRLEDSKAPSYELYENELALDVGNLCWGYQGELRAVIDHHFTRIDQFPSATAAVLHLGRKIAKRWNNIGAEAQTIWLVTHCEPDFDAFCSMYLARCIMTGEIASDWSRLGAGEAGWSRADGSIDWFHPNLKGLSAEERWPILLAHYASLVDNCRPLVCARNASLHSVLYAALVRGRDYETTGAVEFFEACREAISSGLHPQFDSVLENDPRFRPERVLLAGENERYESDVRRAAKSIVFLPEYSGTFEEFFEEVRTMPLLDAQGEIRAEHTPKAADSYVQTDAIFIKDPSSLLFKEWARLDRENSALGQGFTFTGIVYSNTKVSDTVNGNEYYFSLDIENAGRRHLYYAWAELQHAETQALARSQTAKEGIAREDFIQRAGTRPGWFRDPWFDGANYRSTIVVTPFDGTQIAGAGICSDLSDDSIVKLVRNHLEMAPFRDHIKIVDYPLVNLAAQPESHTVDLFQAAAGGAPPVSGSLRFAILPHAPLSGSIERPAAERLGVVLWKTLHPESIGTPDIETLRHHFVFEESWAGIWTRHGIALVVCPLAEKAKDEIHSAMKQLSELICKTQALVPDQLMKDSADNKGIDEQLAESRKRLAEILRLEQKLTYPGLYIVRCLFEATQARHMLDALSHLTEVQSSLDQTKQLVAHTHTVANVQSNLEVFEVLLAVVYGAEIVQIFFEGNSESHPHVWWILGGALSFGLLAFLILKPHKRH